MDYDGVRDFLNSPSGRALMDFLEIHCHKGKEEVVRRAIAKDYDPMEVRFRAGVSVGQEIILNAVRQLRKAPDAAER